MRQLLSCLLLAMLCSSQGARANDSLDISKQIKLVDSIEHAMNWRTGKLTIANGSVSLNIPQGFKFLDAEQSKYVLHDVWGNPERNDILGMLFPATGGLFADSSFAFVITYEETGYVKDSDADKIDYSQMLKDIKDSEKEDNLERAKNGYEPIHILSWAQTPFYDKQQKVLHWAKELQFGDDEGLHTLNYDVRVLGRRGILSMNAVAGMTELGLVKANIKEVMNIATFTTGNTYADFDSNSDKVAEYGLGALVAGGILAKTGILASIGKFLLAIWKVLAIGLVAVFGGIKKFFKTKKQDDDFSQPSDKVVTPGN